MFVEGEEVNLGNYDKEAPKDKLLPWEHYSIEELLSFRDQITAHLPPTSLKDINLEAELLVQLHSLRALQTQVIGDADVAVNQRAQVANAVSNTLDRLVSMQSEVYTQERFKAIENLMIRCLNKLPEEVSVKFLQQYEAILENQDLTK